MRSLTVREKCLIWLIAGYFFAYLTAFFVFNLFSKLAFFSEISLRFYSLGFIASLVIMLFLIPLFVILALLWSWGVRRFPHLDDFWLPTIIFSFIIASACLLLVYLLFIDGAHFTWGVALIVFSSGFFGSLLPRILIKFLRPGNLWR